MTLTPNTAHAAVKPCAMYKTHGSAVSVITEGHHIRPEFLQRRVYNGDTPDNEKVWLCPNCHTNLHAWLYFLLGEWREPNPHPPARSKAWAQEAYDWYQQALTVSG